MLLITKYAALLHSNKRKVVFSQGEFIKKRQTGPCFYCIFLHQFINSICIFFFSLLVSISGNIEGNLGPNRKPNEALLICHWNLDSISPHKFATLHLLNLLCDFLRSRKQRVVLDNVD